MKSNNVFEGLKKISEEDTPIADVHFDSLDCDTGSEPDEEFVYEEHKNPPISLDVEKEMKRIKDFNDNMAICETMDDMIEQVAHENGEPGSDLDEPDVYHPSIEELSP